MTTELHPIANNVNLLRLRHIDLLDTDNVDAWLFAIDMTGKERSDAIRRVLEGEEFCVSNIEYRVTVSCSM